MLGQTLLKILCESDVEVMVNVTEKHVDGVWKVIFHDDKILSKNKPLHQRAFGSRYRAHEPYLGRNTGLGRLRHESCLERSEKLWFMAVSIMYFARLIAF